MEDHITTIDQLRHFAPLDYRYQLEDALASLEPHTKATFAGLTEALSDENPEVRFLATQILDELDSEAETTIDCYEPRLTVEQLVTLLREPHPDHEFFEPEEDACDQQQLRWEFSPEAIQHVALCELVEQRAAEAVPDILLLIERPSANEEVRLHAARAVFDITGEELEKADDESQRRTLNESRRRSRTGRKTG
jgi:HEAT repeat protein